MKSHHGARSLRFGALLCLLAGALAGCTADPSKEDPSRSYFDGGALRDPQPTTIVLTGRVLKSQGRIEEAEFVLRRVVFEYPGFAPGYAELGELLIKDGRVRDAVMVLQNGLAELPKNAMLHNDLGMCMVVLERFDAAADEFIRARELEPEDAAYTANLAMVMGLEGRYDAAVALYAEVLPVSDAHANVAVLAEARGDFDRARDDRAIRGSRGALRRSREVPPLASMDENLAARRPN